MFEWLVIEQMDDSPLLFHMSGAPPEPYYPPRYGILNERGYYNTFGEFYFLLWLNEEDV
jgi:hypothetical protein